MRVWKKEKKNFPLPPTLTPRFRILGFTHWKLEGNRRRHIKVRRATDISNLTSWHFRTAVPLIFPSRRDWDMGLLSSETVIRTKACWLLIFNLQDCRVSVWSPTYIIYSPPFCSAVKWKVKRHIGYNIRHCNNYSSHNPYCNTIFFWVH